MIDRDRALIERVKLTDEDLDRLEALAKAANLGKWFTDIPGEVCTITDLCVAVVATINPMGEMIPEQEAAWTDFIAAANPAVILALLSAARDEGRAEGLGGWEPIETAPTDGRHIQAAIIGTSFGFNAGRPLPEVQTVVHWFSDPDAPGFYTSVNEQEPQRPFPATHWKYLTRIVPLPAEEEGGA